MKRFITLLSAGAVALMLSNSVMAGTESPVTAAQIQAAKTPADHEAIAVASRDHYGNLVGNKYPITRQITIALFEAG